MKATALIQGSDCCRNRFSVIFLRPVNFSLNSGALLMKFKLFLATIWFFSLPANLSAQPVPGNHTAQLQIAATEKSKTGKEAVCDGALELIPSGKMNFVRKRYTPPVKKASSKSHRSGARR